MLLAEQHSDSSENPAYENFTVYLQIGGELGTKFRMSRSDPT
jgi:hypothetical protein